MTDLLRRMFDHVAWADRNVIASLRAACGIDAKALEFNALLSGAGADKLEQPVSYRNSAGDEFKSAVRDILAHVALHGSYHRGQIAALVRAAGTKPASTDFIAFARGAPAATRQP